jgi:DNA polymerase-3 subunit epsilon
MDITQLKRPLVFFDLESTGLSAQQDQIIQFCFESFLPDGGYALFTEHARPSIPISEAATAVHGIKEGDLQFKCDFKVYASRVHKLISDCDLVGFGILGFDVPLLFNELHRSGIVWDYTKCNIIDSCNIYKKQVPRDLTSAFKYYCHGTFEDAHNAHTDTLAAREVFLAQLVRHNLSLGDLPALARYSNYDRPLVDLSGKFTVDESGEIIINIGSNKGGRAKDHIPFIHWMLDKDFSEDVKIICRKIIQDQQPQKELF